MVPEGLGGLIQCKTRWTSSPAGGCLPILRLPALAIGRPALPANPSLPLCTPAPTPTYVPLPPCPACSEFLKRLKGAQRPMIIVGPGVLQRADRDAVLQKVCVCVEGWRGVRLT